jgi:hypothetical protein
MGGSKAKQPLLDEVGVGPTLMIFASTSAATFGTFT